MEHICRFCNSKLTYTFIDLGTNPLSNALLNSEMLNNMEPHYPLHVFVCDRCFLVQLEEFKSPAQIFTDYIYFSSYSDTWLEHAKNYVETMTIKFGFDTKDTIIEIASNDGYLLQYFQKKNIPVLGIEPAVNVAEIAKRKGIPTLVKFFGTKTAKDLVSNDKSADLLLGNNVLAHVPDINDFVTGLKILLKPDGVITMEFPHLMKLIQYNQFDTIYHEHFSYFSLNTVQKIFSTQGLQIFDVDQLPTHGGSLRIYATHQNTTHHKINQKVNDLIENEIEYGLTEISTYLNFSEKVRRTKRKLLNFLIDVKNNNKTIVGYGAAAKGNTLLNYCGIGSDFLDYVVDKNPHKQGLYLPGTHIPIMSPEKINETKPDYVLILPWNIKDEVMSQMNQVYSWGGKFITPIPEVQVYG